MQKLSAWQRQMSARSPRAIKFWAPVVLWASAILLLSSIPGKDIPKISFPNIDKVVHFSSYLAFGLLMTRACVGSSSNISLAKAIFFSIIAVLLFGGFDEMHQHLIPGRTPDIFDFTADAAGAFAGAMIYNKWKDECQR